MSYTRMRKISSNFLKFAGFVPGCEPKIIDCICLRNASHHWTHLLTKNCFEHIRKFMTERRGRTPNREGHSRWTLLRLCGDDDNNFFYSFALSTRYTCGFGRYMTTYSFFISACANGYCHHTYSQELARNYTPHQYLLTVSVLLQNGWKRSWRIPWPCC